MKSICIVKHELLLRKDMCKEECKSALSCSIFFCLVFFCLVKPQSQITFFISAPHPGELQQ